MQKPLLCFLLPTIAPLERERESERATVCILHDAGAIAPGIRVSLVGELLDFHHLVQSLRPLSTLILQRIQCMRIAEGAAAAAFPVVEFCNSARKKKKWRLASELLQISREPWSIVGRLQLWNTSTSTCSVADQQRDHRTIDCLALTDGEISICCSVASLHPQFLGQLVQVNILCPFSPAA
ncbi:unnamed protein product [Sphagnum jensenii]|uniref:Secreted protein n=1 Tax=Sphagnum jensenii TaxID=128206 RepID=A0ABP1BDZ0_9BRYO